MYSIITVTLCRFIVREAEYESVSKQNLMFFFCIHISYMYAFFVCLEHRLVSVYLYSNTGKYIQKQIIIKEVCMA